MTGFVNRSTLLRRHQQQQEAKRFENVSHSIGVVNHPIQHRKR
jgi:hypothetical protein